jgi:hypothetical protein
MRLKLKIVLWETMLTMTVEIYDVDVRIASRLSVIIPAVAVFAVVAAVVEATAAPVPLRFSSFLPSVAGVQSFPRHFYV